MPDVLCGTCQLELDESPSLPADQRKPCPRCGARNRTQNVLGSGGVTITSGAIDAYTANELRGSLVLQAVVEFGDKTHDGQIITAIAPAWFEILKLMADDPAVLFKIPPRKLEEMIAGAYERRGFQVTLTSQSGDHGRDVIAEKSGWGSILIIDQVKAYKAGHLVKADDVRSLIGVLASTELRANKGVVTTTSDFAPRILDDPGIKSLVPTRIELVNGCDLAARLKALHDAPGTW